MEIKSVLRFAGMVLSPACVCLMIAAGCTTESEIPLPPGAYVAPPEKQVPPENSALSTEPALGLPPDQSVTFPKDSDEQAFKVEELTVEEPATKPVPAKKEDAPEKTTPAFAKDDIIYTIRKNDTLSGIARRYGMKASSLADYNGISSKSKIYAGKTLHIPAVVKPSSAAAESAAIPAGASVYVVRSGDTLGGIAQKHSVRTADLAAANNLDIRKPIRVGQKLIIPAGSKKETATAASAAKQDSAKKAFSSSTKKTSSAKTSSSSAAKKSSSAKKASSASAEKKTSSADAKKAASSTAAPAAKTEPAAGQKSADDLLKDIGSDSAGQTEAAPASAKPAAEPKNSSISVTPPAKEEAIDDNYVIEINIEREMTLEETAKAFDRSYSAVKKLNPTISPDTRLKAGTAVKIPIL